MKKSTLKRRLEACELALRIAEDSNEDLDQTVAGLRRRMAELVLALLNREALISAGNAESYFWRSKYVCERDLFKAHRKGVPF